MLNSLGKYLMNLEKVYEIIEKPNETFNQNIIIKSKEPLSDAEIQGIKECAKEVVPILYTITIKNIYDGGERVHQIV